MKTTERPILAQILIIFAVPVIAVACAGLFSLLALALYTGASIDHIPSLMSGVPSQQVIDAYKITQLISTVFVFMLPPLILPWLLFQENPLDYLRARKKSHVTLYILTALIFYAASPLLDFTIVWNSKLHLPGFMHDIETWMQQGEDTNDKITAYFLKMPNIGSLITNIIIIALLPAIAEEFMFRGFIQRILVSWTKRPHLAILLSAAIFSFIHFQFYGFVPRMLLGMLFGYLFYWSGDIKLPIFAHFINNFVGVMAAYYHPENIDVKPEDLPMNHVYIYYLSLLALGVLVFAFYWLSRSYHKSVEDNLKGRPDRWVKIYTSPQTFEAEIIVGNLESEGIEAVVVNKKSSSYTVFGEAEVHVHEIDAERALEIIKAGNTGESQS